VLIMRMWLGVLVVVLMREFVWVGDGEVGGGRREEGVAMVPVECEVGVQSDSLELLLKLLVVAHRCRANSRVHL